MRYRKGIDVSKATEKELLRYQMERIVKESNEENLGSCSNAFKGLYDSFENTRARRLIFLAACFYLGMNFLIFCKKFFRG